MMERYILRGKIEYNEKLGKKQIKLEYLDANDISATWMYIFLYYSDINQRYEWVVKANFFTTRGINMEKSIRAEKTLEEIVQEDLLELLQKYDEGYTIEIEIPETLMSYSISVYEPKK